MRLDIAYTAHQCACFSVAPRKYHTLTVRQIVRYLLGTKDKGIILDPKGNDRDSNRYGKIDFSNLSDTLHSPSHTRHGQESNAGERRQVALAAPGHRITARKLNGQITTATGTSFATPHVTGTVALLQEWGDRQLVKSCKRGSGCSLPWTTDARRHEVMKVVLMNSADKLQDSGDRKSVV